VQGLCDDCGLCCDGTLFESVAIRANELDGVVERRLPIVRTSQGAKMPLPCSALDGVRCAIYGQHPARCQSYRCELVADVDAGRVSLAYARRVIDRVRELRSVVDAQLPEGMRWWTAEARLRRSQGAGGDHQALRELGRLVRHRLWQ